MSGDSRAGHSVTVTRYLIETRLGVGLRLRVRWIENIIMIKYEQLNIQCTVKLTEMKWMGTLQIAHLQPVFLLPPNHNSPNINQSSA